MPKTIDITGDWRLGNAFSPHIQVCEPVLQGAGEEHRTFNQVLSLPAGQYRIELEYDSKLDRKPGQALDESWEDFRGLRINGAVAPLSFIGSRGAINITFEVDYPQVVLELSVRNTRPMRSWLVAPGEVPTGGSYRAVAPEGDGELLLAHGVPFLAGKLDFVHIPALLCQPPREAIRPWRDGMELNCGGAKVEAAHFLGMIHSIDLANGSWFSPKGDHGYSHFVGDNAGEIVIAWADGGHDSVPLIFGFNLWYGRPWDILWAYEPFADAPAGPNCDAQLFGGHAEYRDVIRDGVALTDGIRLMGARSSNARFIFSVDLQGRAVRSIAVRGNQELYGHPLISAVTLETHDDSSALLPLPQVSREPPNLNLVSLDSVARRAYLPGVERIMRVLYTFSDEQPPLDQPEIPSGYLGPRYDFAGPRQAAYAATYLYRNGPECASHCPEAGTTCASKTAAKNLSHYTLGMGVWRQEDPPFKSIENWFTLYQRHVPGTLLKTAWPQLRPSAWSRGVGELLRETVALGYDKFAECYVDWMDRCLLTEANPPHWNRVLGEPECCTTSRQVGDTIEKGNRENDGHGICMWGRYMAWHWAGRSREWNVKHWLATKAAVEWIQWQLDTDTIFPGVRKDVLWTESECAHASYDFYSSYNCLHGLKLSIRLAEQADEHEQARQWKQLYHRLRQGILDHLVDQTSDGPVWHTEPNCEWQDHAHKLAHLHLSTEGDSYTPLQDYAAGDDIERRYLEIGRNSYRALMKQKNYDCLRMFGYGQGMMTQAALLLDEMADAEQFINMMVTHCYLPRLDGWATPEGILVHRSGNYYLPVNGYLGQDSHVADSVKALRLMLGVDDNDPDHLRLVPRFPATWTRAAIAEFPVLTGNLRQKLQYVYEREPEQLSLRFSLDQPVNHLSLRLGPIDVGRSVAGVWCDVTRVSFEAQDSGDSKWIWVRDLKGDNGTVTVKLQSQ